MNLKNYTSSVPMSNSISMIEHKLAQAGATHIAKSYDGEKAIGMIFQIPINGTPMTFKLPAKTERVFDFIVNKELDLQKKTSSELFENRQIAPPGKFSATGLISRLVRL